MFFHFFWTYFHFHIRSNRNCQYFLTKSWLLALDHCLSLWNGISWSSNWSSSRARLCQQPIDNILLYIELSPIEQKLLPGREFFLPANTLKKSWDGVGLSPYPFEFQFVLNLAEITYVKLWKQHRLEEEMEKVSSSFWSYCTSTVPLSNQELIDQDCSAVDFLQTGPLWDNKYWRDKAKQRHIQEHDHHTK